MAVSARDVRGQLLRLPGRCSCRASQGSCAGQGQAAAAADSKGGFAAHSAAGKQREEGKGVPDGILECLWLEGTWLWFHPGLRCHEGEVPLPQ